MVGEDYSNSESAKRCCEFLRSKQREDGGWSESYREKSAGISFSPSYISSHKDSSNS
ncbi:hypothetical protein B0J14DRAFT_607046 [Halenospora varia]|nr:hypothetical protein B0J14DRAFT_607046 [Halenospora varia]